MDQIDKKILEILQKRGNTTNAELGEACFISTSQAGRRRQRLEQLGTLQRYQAKLSPKAIGLGVQAFIQVSMKAHSAEAATEFQTLLDARPEIINLWTITGAADYLLQVYCQDLEALNDLVHHFLLRAPSVTHVESQIVMNHLLKDRGLPLSQA
ncbi:MAG: Lrp/AsnC family transcriptional regulator [Gammaproteobacteria bacterium]|nr:Lrp/AsnC family transcriptional regulator [Gammaproteobacteria bacterium]